MIIYQVVMPRFLLLIGFFCPLFFLFTYNSGYGYDAYEYLIIGRTLSKGYALYDFILTKSYLLYSSTNVLLTVLGGYNHVSISLLITVLATAAVVAVWLATRILGARTALLSAGLTAVSCFFMEMNFLEPESWVVICGASAFGVAIRQDGRPGWRWLLAGALLGLGMCFKSVAAFYVVGFGAYILLLTLTGRQTIGQMLTRGPLVLVGFALPLLLSAGYFWATGRLADHLEWTYSYPFGGYPSHTLFLAKFFVKLGWFLALLLASVALLSVPKFRAGFAQTPASWLALLLAVFSCASLLKTQASHYFFPAAAFFAVFMAFMLNQWLVAQQQRSRNLTRKLLLGGPVAALLLAVSVGLYRPDAAKRFVTLADYGGEAQTGAFLRQQAGPDGKVLLIDNAMSLYFLTDREPNVPFIHTEMQTTHYIKSHPDTYARALADTSLKLVVFGNRSSVIDDSTALTEPANARAIGQLRQGLQTHFQRVDTTAFPMTYYVRKPVSR